MVKRNKKGQFVAQSKYLLICCNCKKEFSVHKCRLAQAKFCSVKCRMSGRFNPRWNGGRKIGGDGHILISKPNHPFASTDGYVREHRLVMEKVLKRFLKPQEIVHHINGDCSDNRKENLEVYESNSKHLQFHHPKGKQIANNKDVKTKST